MPHQRIQLRAETLYLYTIPAQARRMFTRRIYIYALRQRASTKCAAHKLRTTADTSPGTRRKVLNTVPRIWVACHAVQMMMRYTAWPMAWGRPHGRRHGTDRMEDGVAGSVADSVSVGAADGTELGAGEGMALGAIDGSALGSLEGPADGAALDTRDGEDNGKALGAAHGWSGEWLGRKNGRQ